MTSIANGEREGQPPMDDEAYSRALRDLIDSITGTRYVKLTPDFKQPLLHVGVTLVRLAPDLLDHVQSLMGVPYKPAGTSAWWKNRLDPFVRSAGGIRRNQTLFRRDLEPGVALYCSFWPWDFEPERLTFRVGMFCADPALLARISARYLAADGDRHSLTDVRSPAGAPT
jgi:hypothetical protein